MSFMYYGNRIYHHADVMNGGDECTLQVFFQSCI